MSAGRSGEQAAQGLTQNLHEIGIKTERLKTGTPARVDKRSIIFDELDIEKTEQIGLNSKKIVKKRICLLYTSPSPRDSLSSRMPSSA